MKMQVFKSKLKYTYTDKEFKANLVLSDPVFIL